MIKILIIIEGDYEVDPRLSGLIKVNHKIFVANPETALDVTEKDHIDIILTMADDPEKESIEDFTREFFKTRLRVTPILFITKKFSEYLLTKTRLRGNRYLLQYPVDFNEFEIAFTDALATTDLVDDKTIILEKKGHQYRYKASEIYAINLSGTRRIKIFGRAEMDEVQGERDFFYKPAFKNLPAEFGIEKYLVQARSNWLVNPLHIKETSSKDEKIFLRNGMVVPSSRDNIKKFKK